MVKTAPTQMANRQIKNGTTERRPNLSNGASVIALSTTSSATLASRAATDAIERKASWIIQGHYIPSITSIAGPSPFALEALRGASGGETMTTRGGARTLPPVLGAPASLIGSELPPLPRYGAPILCGK